MRAVVFSSYESESKLPSHEEPSALHEVWCPRRRQADPLREAVDMSFVKRPRQLKLGQTLTANPRFVSATVAYSVVRLARGRTR